MSTTITATNNLIFSVECVSLANAAKSFGVDYVSCLGARPLT